MSKSRFSKGSTFMVAFFALASVFFGVIAFVQPERRLFALVFVAVGLAMTWRHYQAWKPKKG